MDFLTLIQNTARSLVVISTTRVETNIKWSTTKLPEGMTSMSLSSLPM
ncbi:MAG: hypothetical protein QXD96_08235 [Pyrobaculum sp.]